jgi:hypothetical protein
MSDTRDTGWPSTGHHTVLGQRCTHEHPVTDYPGGPVRLARCGNVTLDPSGLCYRHKAKP